MNVDMLNHLTSAYQHLEAARDYLDTDAEYDMLWGRLNHMCNQVEDMIFSHVTADTPLKKCEPATDVTYQHRDAEMYHHHANPPPPDLMQKVKQVKVGIM